MALEMIANPLVTSLAVGKPFSNQSSPVDEKRLENIRVLLAEDNLVNQRIVTGILRKAGAAGNCCRRRWYGR